MIKITIIGMGYLMDYIYPCYEGFLGSDNLKDTIIAVTADEKTIKEKRKKYEFPVLLNDNLKALRKLNPDIILFAPPPKAVPAIIENELKTYFDELRTKDMLLPDIYAFPPSPSGDYYMKVLGDDIFVCNILPNMVKEINGVSLNGKEGFNYINYPQKLQKHIEKKQRVSEFFQPLGETIEIPSDKVMEVLAGFVMIDLWPIRAFLISDIEGIKKHSCVIDYFPGESRFSKYYKAINESILEFYIKNGIDKETAEKIISGRCSLVLHEAKDAQCNKLLKSIETHATKGGVLEKGINLHNAVINELTKKYFSSGNPQFLQELFKAVYSCLIIISEHGSKLADLDSVPQFNPGHHAMLHAIYIRNIKKSNFQDSDKLIKDTVVKYAVQRGERMAKRVLADKKELTAENYMAYGEWKADADSVEINVLNFNSMDVTRVTKCPWFTEWGKFGYISEGAVYCKYIDENLVKGFNKEINLDINSIMSNGDDFCEFYWYGADYDAVIEVSQEKRLKPWIYHIAHLYNTIKELNEHIPFLLDNINKDFYTIYGIDLRASLKSYENTDFSSI